MTSFDTPHSGLFAKSVFFPIANRSIGDSTYGPILSFLSFTPLHSPTSRFCDVIALPFPYSSRNTIFIAGRQAKAISYPFHHLSLVIGRPKRARTGSNINLIDSTSSSTCEFIKSCLTWFANADKSNSVTCRSARPLKRFIRKS